MPTPPPKIPPHAPPGFIPPKPLSQRQVNAPLQRAPKLSFGDIAHRTAVWACLGTAAFGAYLAVHGVIVRYRQSNAMQAEAQRLLEGGIKPEQAAGSLDKPQVMPS